MRFAGTILETYPNGVTLAVEVRVEAPDGDAARPVADAVMAALEARRLWQGVTRRVVPVAMVPNLMQGFIEDLVETPVQVGMEFQMSPTSKKYIVTG